MRFLVDECTGPAVARWLEQAGHDVASVFPALRGASDDAVIQRARDENRILITNDKDFGEKAFRDGHVHAGIILLRLDDERASSKIGVLRPLLVEHADQLTGKFVVVTEAQVRFATA